MNYLVLALLVSSSLAAPHRGGGGRGGRGNRPFYYGSSRPQSAFNLPSQALPSFNYPSLGQNQPSIENFGQNIPNIPSFGQNQPNLGQILGNLGLGQNSNLGQTLPNFGQNLPNLGGQQQQQQQLAQLAQQFPGGLSQLSQLLSLFSGGLRTAELPEETAPAPSSRYIDTTDEGEEVEKEAETEVKADEEVSDDITTDVELEEFLKLCSTLGISPSSGSYSSGSYGNYGRYPSNYNTGYSTYPAVSSGYTILPSTGYTGGNTGL